MDEFVTMDDLSRFRALCMEEAAQIAENERSEPSPYQGELEYRVYEKAFETAQSIAHAIRAAAKQ